MSSDMLGERETTSVSGDGRDNTGKRYRDHLVCFRDTDRAEAVCGDCGCPVCGPILNVSLRGMVSSLFNDPGHGRQFHDATFHQYRSGLKRVTFSIGMLGTALLFSVIFPDIIPALVSAVFLSSIGLKPAIVHSAVILGIAGMLTLRYQPGERITSLRIRERRTVNRVVCDKCFENRLVQVLLTYALTAVFVVLILLGIKEIVTKGSLRPLRLVAVGFGLGMLRDDVVAYVMEILETGEREPETAPNEHSRIDSGSGEFEIKIDPDSHVGDEQTGED